MRYPLVDGQGNFGSIDGDPPAAMRYTEARLSRFAAELMSQIERNTIDFVDNFDGTLTEPEVLPAAAPNLLVNGASGIAVGMATSIPPHNLGEVIDALTFMLEKWDQLDDIGVEDLMQFVHGPDFPTGGIILQEGVESGTGLLSAYGSGKGRITVRGRIHTEDMGRGRNRLIITELPYQTNKTTLIERIAELVRSGHLDGIADLRDESDRQGMRIVIELKQGVEMEDTLRGLYQRTPLQSTFGISLLALVDGEPRLLNLKQALRVFLEHRQVVVKRRSEFDLARARHRAHILEGLRVALKNLDEVISIIRNAPDVETARARLIKRFQLSEIQAQAILDMQLRRLASLERKKIEEEYKEVSAHIKELEGLLRSAKRMRQVVGEELLVIKESYSDRRRTQIFSLKEGDSAKTLLTTTDLTPAQTVWVGVTEDGKIGRLIGESLPDGMPRHLLRVSTHETLYLASTQGQAAAVAVHVLPEVTRFDAGAPLYKACALDPEDQLAFLFHLPQDAPETLERYILTCSRQGMMKKTIVTDLPGPSAQRFALVRINNEDELLSGMVTDGGSDLLLVTAQGMGIRFAEDEIRPMGLVAAGVMGIKLGDGDAVAAMLPWSDKAEVLMLASDGSGLRVKASDFPKQGRYGQGVIACRVAKGLEIIGAAAGSSKTTLMVFMLKSAIKKLRFADASLVKRGGKSSMILKVKAGDEPSGLMVVDVSPAKPVDNGNGTRKKVTGVNGEKPAGKTPAQTTAKAKAESGSPRTARTTSTRSKASGGATRSAAMSPPKPAAQTKKKTVAGTPAAATPRGKASTPTAAPAARKRAGTAAAVTDEAASIQKTATKPKASPTGGKPARANTPADKPAARKRGAAAGQPAQTDPVTPAKPATRKKTTPSQPSEQQLLPGLDPARPKPRKGKAEG